MGAIALFGEKYGESVRVIRFADSIELCGGTHTSSTGNIGLFKIISESAIAAGVRRIEATTGVHAEKLIENEEDTIKTIKLLLNNTPNVINAVQKLVSENDTLGRNLEEAMKERAKALKERVVQDMEVVKGIKVMILKGEHNPEVVKNVAFMIRAEFTSAAFIAGYSHEGKASLALMYTDDMTSHGYNASKDIREAAKYINGGGGGQNFFATAGGKNPDGISDAIVKLIEMVSK